MKNKPLIILVIAATFCVGFSFKTIITKQPSNNIDVNKTNYEKETDFYFINIDLNIL